MSCTKEQCRPRNVYEELDRGLNQFMRGVLSAETQAKGEFARNFVRISRPLPDGM